MTYVQIHRYDKADDGDWCAVVVPGGHRDRGAAICCEFESHPVHDVGNTALEDLARALAAHSWPRRGSSDEESRRIVQHRNHSHHAQCALCNGDVHSVAAFALAYLDAKAGRPAQDVDPAELAADLASGALRLARITRQHWNAQHPEHPLPDPQETPR